MTESEALRAQWLIAAAAPYRIPAEALAFWVARPLEQGLASITAAKLAVEREFGASAQNQLSAKIS